METKTCNGDLNSLLLSGPWRAAPGWPTCWGAPVATNPGPGPPAWGQGPPAQGQSHHLPRAAAAQGPQIREVPAAHTHAAHTSSGWQAEDGSFASQPGLNSSRLCAPAVRNTNANLFRSAHGNPGNTQA